MAESFETKYVFDVEKIDTGKVADFPIWPTESFYPAASYATIIDPNVLTPLEYTGWRDETEAWHRTCTICSQISPSPVTTVSGPEAIDFLRENLVNNVDNWPIGASKNGLMLLEDGTIATQGVMLRSGDQEYQAFWLTPFIDYRFSLKDWDATCVTTTAETFVFQMEGPKSLQILEEACEEDLHDIGFCRSRMSSIAGFPVRILRFGMGNSLGYEVHGDMSGAAAVHKRILEVGMPHGIRRMGCIAYEMNHTTGGSQQAGKHFDLSCFADQGYVDYVASTTGDDFSLSQVGAFDGGMIYEGSFDGAPEERYCTPLEVGLSKVVNWGHEFIGRDALLTQRGNLKRSLKTLVWNPDDIADIYRSQFTSEPYRFIDDGGYWPGAFGGIPMPVDRVLDMDGNKIGFSGGRMTDWWNKAMISMAVMDVQFCMDGTEVQVVWGEPGTRQKLVRATVAPVPFNTHLENRTFDLSSIPSYQA